MPTILIADDDADHRELLTISMHRIGYEAVVAEDAASAMRLALAGGVDGALLDVRMPGESGISLCERLRAEPGTADLPIVLISADVCGTRMAAALEAGADDYVTKPFHRADLAARLDSLLLRRGSAHGRAINAAMLASRAAGAARGAIAGAPARPVEKPRIAQMVRIA